MGPPCPGRPGTGDAGSGSLPAAKPGATQQPERCREEGEADRGKESRRHQQNTAGRVERCHGLHGCSLKKLSARLFRCLDLSAEWIGESEVSNLPQKKHPAHHNKSRQPPVVRLTREEVDKAECEVRPAKDQSGQPEDIAIVRMLPGRLIEQQRQKQARQDQKPQHGQPVGILEPCDQSQTASDPNNPEQGVLDIKDDRKVFQTRNEFGLAPNKRECLQDRNIIIRALALTINRSRKATPPQQIAAIKDKLTAKNNLHQPDMNKMQHAHADCDGNAPPAKQGLECRHQIPNLSSQRQRAAGEEQGQGNRQAKPRGQQRHQSDHQQHRDSLLTQAPQTNDGGEREQINLEGGSAIKIIKRRLPTPLPMASPVALRSS